MGLDQYLEARKYVSNWSFSGVDEKKAHAKVLEALELTEDDISEDFQSVSVEVPVAYWRKASQIHEWFVENLQEGIDDCGSYNVGRVELEALHLLCGQVMDNPRLAPELLPLGNHAYAVNDYNQWYFEQIADTRRMLRKVLDNEKFMDYDFIYRSSW